MRKLVLSLTLAGALGAAAIPAFAATKSVKVGDNFFVKDGGTPTVTVTKGTKVTWRWVGSSPHNVVVTSGPARFTSKVLTSGTYSRTVTKKGLYTIVCTIHGAGDMSMKLRVR